MKIAQIEFDRTVYYLFRCHYLELPKCAPVCEPGAYVIRNPVNFDTSFIFPTAPLRSPRQAVIFCSRKRYAAIKSIRLVSSRVLNSIVPSLCDQAPSSRFSPFCLFFRFVSNTPQLDHERSFRVD